MSEKYQYVDFGPAGQVRVSDHGGGVAMVTLHDPQRRNAMTTDMTEAWGHAVEHLAERDRTGDLSAVVLTGSGSAFCAGGDLGWIGAKPGASVSDLRDRMVPFYATWLSLRRLSVPSIAAVNGVAVGAGAAIVLACDIAIAGSGAGFSVPFTTLGLHPGMGISYLLPATVGLPAARDLLLTGRRIDAEEMLRLGIVSRVVDADDLVDQALSTAHGIAGCAPVATRLTRATLMHPPSDLDEALRTEGVVQAVTLATYDLAEGLAAAQERREPRFTGR
jgi:enoyl-CoA hydratase/carnithine racemase